MRPDNMKQYNELLWLGIPRNKRTDVRGMESTRYVDPCHVVFVELTRPPKDFEDFQIPQYTEYTGVNEGSIRRPETDTPEMQSVHLPVEYLRRILDNVTANDIVLHVTTDFPLRMSWQDKEDTWTVWIAPRIENE